jgi:microcystin-dependent protein
MPSTYTGSGIELIADGEQSGTWGQTTNTNLQIINRMTSEFGTIALSGTTHTLTISDGTLSDGQYGVLIFNGSPSGTNTVTISPNDAKRIFMVENTSGQTVIMTQGSGGNVSILDGDGAIVYCNGDGASAAVFDIGSTLKTTNNLVVANNLSDLANTTTARTNLGLGTAAVLDVGTSANNIVQLNGSAQLPAVDGSLLTGIEGVPSGFIGLWSGSVASIPSGWVLCNGSNSTPDLRNFFIVGAGDAYAVGATGGANTVALSAAELAAHTHSVSGTTASDGAHTHNVSGNTSNTGAHTHNVSGNTSNTGDHSHNGSTSNTGAHTHSGRNLAGQGQPDDPGGATNPYVSGGNPFQAKNPISYSTVPDHYNISAGNHSHNFSTSNTGAHSHTLSGTADSAGNHSHTLSGTADSAGAHTHTLSTTSGSTGSGTAHENRPPYYALAYIMKT